MYPPIPITDRNAVVHYRDDIWLEFWDLGRPAVKTALAIREALESGRETWESILDSGDFIYDVDFIIVRAPDAC